MTLRKTLRDLVVDNAARFRQGVRATFGDESDDEVSVRFDGTALVIEDETNNVEQVRIPLGDDLATLVESGGQHEINVTGLSGDLATRQNPVNHSGRHSQGGADELDAAELSGANGSDGQALRTDGTSATWETPAAIGSDDFVWEKGSFTFSDRHSEDMNNTTDISFNNTYAEAIVALNPREDTPHADDAAYVHHDNWNTDGSGNITGATIRWGTYSLDSGASCRWQVFGVIA